VPVQAPLAVQEVAPVEDQVSVVLPPKLTLAGAALMVTVGAAGGVVVPPPPPPPQAASPSGAMTASTKARASGPRSGLCKPNTPNTPNALFIMSPSPEIPLLSLTERFSRQRMRNPGHRKNPLL
jgi:hypothetical protein